MIRAFLRRMGLTDADADDGTQDILMIAHAALQDGTYDRSRGKFRAWLYGVARKKALEAHRNRRRPSRAQSVERPDGMDLLSGIEDRQDEAERDIWEQEWRYAILAEAMRQVKPVLGDNVFEAFLQYGVQRRPAEQVAADLGISVSSVYVYKQRALQAIRQWVSQYEPDEQGGFE
jgi:RNA polymerase sigma-70 factor (ECF subfamily)